MRNGNAYPLFPCDANAMQVAYEYATNSFNKSMTIIASKSPLPIYMSLDEARTAIDEGAATIYESTSGDKGTVVFAVTGDMIYLPVFETKDKLEAEGYKVRIVAVLNPRRLYRPSDIAWDTVSQPDDKFMSDDDFNALFDGDVLMAVSGGPSAPLEPVLLRTRAPKRDTVCWKRGETTASPDEIMAFNGITPEIMVDRVETMMK
jgi:phosphoketolase